MCVHLPSPVCPTSILKALGPLPSVGWEPFLTCPAFSKCLSWALSAFLWQALRHSCGVQYSRGWPGWTLVPEPRPPEVERLMVKNRLQPGMVVDACNASTWRAEAGRFW